MGIKKRETVALEAGGSSGHTWSQIVFEVTAMANNQKKGINTRRWQLQFLSALQH